MGKAGSVEITSEIHDGHENGIHWVIAAILIIGEMAGGGLVALPESLVDAGLWAGAALSIVSAIVTGYTGIQLGDNWLIMQERWPEYRHACRKPYPEMAYRSLGAWGRVAMTIIMSVQQFCLSVVFILLASNNISSLLFDLFNIKVTFCLIAAVVALIQWPLLMLGSPKDFWQAGLIALLTTSSAIVLIIVGAAHDQTECLKEVNYPPIEISSFFLAFGTIMFAYGGHACFPTFQHDMKNPKEFGKAVIAGYIVVFVMYLPVSIYGYIVYGDSLTGGSIIPSLQVSWVQTAVSILITLHAIFAVIILISPFSLTLEELCRVENKFGLGRFILRTIIVVAVLFVALSIPKFGPIVDLIGGSTTTLMTMILPGVFSLSLVAGKRRSEMVDMSKHPGEADRLPTLIEVFKLNNPWILAINLLVIVFGVIGGVAATVSAVYELIGTDWDIPCYVSLIMGTLDFNSDKGLVNCCGIYKNVTTVDVTAGQFCTAG